LKLTHGFPFEERAIEPKVFAISESSLRSELIVSVCSFRVFKKGKPNFAFVCGLESYLHVFNEILLTTSSLFFDEIRNDARATP